MTSRDKTEAELAEIRQEILGKDDSLSRYFRAFETGSLSQETCAPRIEEVGRQLRKLRNRAATIEAGLDAVCQALPTPVRIKEFGQTIRATVEAGSVTEQKALAQTLVSEVRVGPDSQLQPIFRVPFEMVRELYGVVGRGGLEPPTSALSARRSAS